ncbi:hypothetical protein FrEUN1fDRAFT_4988 [Parafrankia sp. EUN1f]|nr:hypothetical protein FrEUN1fDRAFT_4988 [Parafrankia sp. EUN1f]
MPVGGGLRQCAQHHRLHRGCHAGHRPWRVVQVLVPQCGQRLFRVEWWCSGEQLVEDDSQGVQIRRRPQPAACYLLRRHVHRRADPAAGCRRGSFEQFRDPEVADLGGAVRREQDVVGLDVAVQHAAAVRVCQCGGHRQPHRAGLFRRHSGPPAGQRAAGHQLHHDQAQAFGLDIVERLHHMGMVEAAQHLGLGLEAAGRLLGSVSLHDLDGHRAVSLLVVPGQHQPERSGPQPVADGIAGQRLLEPLPPDDHRASGWVRRPTPTDPAMM